MAEIRKAVPTDAERIAQIHAETWRVAYRDFIPEEFEDNRAKLEPRREMWRTLLAQSHECYVVETGGTVVGFVSMEPSKEDSHACELSCIYFDMAYCRMGLGTQAMQHIISLAQRRGWNELFLWVFQQNQSAIAFYEKFGFRSDGTVHVLPLGKPVPECRYRLTILNKNLK